MSSNNFKFSFPLLLGSLFFYLGTGRFSFSFATWLFPVFFLSVSRNAPKKISYFVMPLICAIISQLSFWNFTSNNLSSIFFYIPFAGGIVIGFLFHLDRVLYKHLTGILKTLVFPLAYTSFDFMLNLFNPFGTLGVLGYSQLEFLSFSQLASLTGMWGITFMITWFASVINTYVINPSNETQKLILLYFSILFSILLYGSIRLQIPQKNEMVKVSGIHTHDKNIEGFAMNLHLEKGDFIGFKKISDSILQSLINATRLETKSGAKIILWSEISSMNLKTDEDSITAVLSNLAKQEKIFLIAPLFSQSTNNSKSVNKILLFDSYGKVILKHIKYGGSFMEGTLEGDKKIRPVQTPFGNLSAIICWDADFPTIVKQIGKTKTDILFNPASDWKEIDPIHTNVAVFRGIENGCSVVRQTRNGLSIITDSKGRIISQVDHFSTNNWIMTGQVPTHRIWSLYPLIGDLFGWVSLVVFILLTIKTAVKIKREKNVANIDLVKNRAGHWKNK